MKIRKKNPAGMKCYLFMLMALLSLTVSANAVPRQDALYIFRNDGQFNAFFYGDIDHIQYSKVDTLGVEQPDYVVQEVYALDTIFRIPITAIDSVAFVTPENIVKADVFCPDKSIADYIIASDSLWWIRLAPNTPASLIPKEGDKLLIEEGSKFIPGGFGGRVVLSVLEDEGWMIITESTPLTDIYDRLVIKSAASTTATQGAKAPNILDGTVYVDVPEVTINIKEIDEEYELENSSISTPEGPIQLSIPLKGSIKVKYVEDLSMRTHLYLDTSPTFNFSQAFKLTTKEAVEANLEGGLKGRILLGGKIPLKEYLPDGVRAKIEAGFFIEGSISGMKFGFASEKEVERACFINVNKTDLGKLVTAFTGGAKPDVIRFSSKTKKNKFEKTSVLPYENGSLQMPDEIGITIGLGATLQAELVSPIEKARQMLPEMVVNYLKKYYKYNEDPNAKNDTLGFNLNLTLEVGGKLEAKAPWRTIWHNKPLLESLPIYKDLSKGKVGGSVYFKAEAKAVLGPWSYGKPAIEPSEPLVEFGVVPNIPKIGVKTAEIEDYVTELELGMEIDERPYNKLFYAPVDGDLIQQSRIGFAIFDEDEKLAQKSCHIPWLNNQFDEDISSFFKNGTYREILPIDPGKGKKVKYTAYPLVIPFTSHGAGGSEMLAEAKCEFEMDSAYIDIEKREITIDKEQHYSIEDRVVPNMKNLQVKAEADWIEDILWIDFKNQLSFGVKALPKDVPYRRGVIRLTGLSLKGEFLIEDSIVIKQGEQQVAAVTITGDIRCSSPTYEKGGEYHLVPVAFAMNDLLPGWIKTTRQGKDLHVECYKAESDEDDNPYLLPGKMVSFDILNYDELDKRTTQIANLKIDNQMVSLVFTTKITEAYKLNVSSRMPQIDERMLPKDDEGDGDVDVDVDVSDVKAWSQSAGGGLGLSLFDFKRKEETFDMMTGEIVKEETHVFSPTNTPSNNLMVVIAFK